MNVLKGYRMDYFINLISTQELADATDLKIRRIQLLANDLINRGLARRIGKLLVCHTSAIDYVLSIKGTRPSRNKSPVTI